MKKEQMHESISFFGLTLQYGEKIAFEVWDRPNPRFEGIVCGVTEEGELMVDCPDILPLKPFHTYRTSGFRWLQKFG